MKMRKEGEVMMKMKAGSLKVEVIRVKERNFRFEERKF